MKSVILLALAGAARADHKVVTALLNPTEVRAIHEEGLDVWHQEPRGELIAVDVMVEHGSERFPGAEVYLESTDAFFQQEREQRKAKSASNWTVARGDDSFFDTFRPYDDHTAFHAELASTYPDVVQDLGSIGNTIEGVPIHTYRVGSPGSAANKTALYLQSTVHAREWLATTSLAFTMATFAEGYGVNETLTTILDQIDIFVTPIVNIDGYKYTWSTSRNWRKNRNPNGGSSYGVDINRNFGPADTWCTEGSSTFPSSDTYCGEAPFSEPETAASAAFIADHPGIGGAVDFHTYGPLILWPWQYTYTRVPEPSYSQLERLGLDIETAINARGGQRFVSEQGSDLYPHSGGIIDWCWEEYGIPSFTFEGRGRGFSVPDSDILPGGQEQLEGIIVLAKSIIENNKK